MAHDIKHMSEIQFNDENDSVVKQESWDEKDITIVVELGLTARETYHVRHVFRMFLLQFNKNEYSPIQNDIQRLFAALNEM